MDEWQKVDNNYISNFSWLSFSVNDKTKQLFKIFIRLRFMTKHALKIFNSYSCFMLERFYCPRNIIHARCSKVSNPRNYVHAKNKKILAREIKTAQKIIHLRWVVSNSLFHFEMKTFIMWAPSFVKWRVDDFKKGDFKKYT